MTYIVSEVIFTIFYIIYYYWPALVIIATVNLFGITIPDYLAAFPLVKNIIKLFLLAYVVLPIYRAKLSADAYGDRDMSFTEAHSASGVMLRTQLSLLPYIGTIFKIKE
jgi:hypothetical protein